MPDEMSDNGFPREDTQQRIKIGIETERDLIVKQWFWKLVGAFIALGGVGSIVAVTMYVAGRASASDLQSTDVRTVKIEQAHTDLVKTVSEIKIDNDKRFDRFEAKVDKIGENLYRVALRSGVPAPLRPPQPTIKPAPPEETRP